MIFFYAKEEIQARTKEKQNKKQTKTAKSHSEK